MKYSVELRSESGSSENVVLTARTDRQAEAELRAWLKSNTVAEDCQVYLAFDRSSDGQHGYLNPDGASPMGLPWKAGAYRGY